MIDASLPVIRTIAPGDGMYRDNSELYFAIGEGALRILRRALQLAAIDEPRRVLDYGCGYGRVLRWLVAAFPAAEIAATDSDAKALQAVRQLFPSVRAMPEPSGAFELVWVGSVLTHLPHDKASALLIHLAELLAPGGVVVATTHGAYVAEKLRTGQRAYGLDSAAVASLVADYDVNGFGFGRYPRQQSYGIAVCTPSELLRMVQLAGLQPLAYEARAWDAHQDAVVAIKPPHRRPPHDVGRKVS